MRSQPATGQATADGAHVKPRDRCTSLHRFEQNIPSSVSQIAKALGGVSRWTIRRRLNEANVKPCSTRPSGADEYWPYDYAIIHWPEHVAQRLVPGYMVNGGTASEVGDES